MNADQYFGEVARYTKQLDPTRPITAAIAVDVNHDEAAKHLDIVSFNRYNAWYQNTGRLDMVTSYVVKEATSWHEVGETLQTGKSPFLPFSHFNSLSLSFAETRQTDIDERVWLRHCRRTSLVASLCVVGRIPISTILEAFRSFRHAQSEGFLHR